MENMSFFSFNFQLRDFPLMSNGLKYSNDSNKQSNINLLCIFYNEFG